MREIAILGSGSWGTALAVHLARVGHDVRLWAREAEVVAEIRSERVNQLFLPGIRLPEAVTPCEAIDEAVSGVDLVVVVTPSHGTRARRSPGGAAPWPNRRPSSARPRGSRSTRFCAPSEVIGQEVGPRRAVVVLSGPSFAREVALELPTAVCAASTDRAAAELVQSEFRGRASASTRPTTSWASRLARR